jgi:hypothetical protein
VIGGEGGEGGEHSILEGTFTKIFLKSVAVARKIRQHPRYSSTKHLSLNIFIVCKFETRKTTL